VSGEDKCLEATTKWRSAGSAPGAGSVLAVLVLHNSSGYVASLVRSLCASDLIGRIIMFDNASDDRDFLGEVCKPLWAEFGGRLILHMSDENLGFGTAVNRAVGMWGSSYAYVLFANPDIALPKEAIEVLCRSLGAQHVLGAVAPVTVRIGEVPYQRCWTTPLSSLRTFFPPLPAKLIRLGLLQEPHDSIGGRAQLWLEGSIVLARLEAYESVGGFDESFFLYAEDEDLCRRLVIKGWELALIDAGTDVTHVRGASRTGKTALVQAHYHASVYGFLVKWYGHKAASVYRIAFVAWTCVRRSRRRSRPDVGAALSLMHNFANRWPSPVKTQVPGRQNGRRSRR
jgi:N-acetylglucosaminyl-diphospho-decaprenol L-rhamnosyltransferase